MAELNEQGGGHKKKGGGGVRSKKMSTRIDMTPMVDLAFLLVTFFMLTTTFSKPQVMQLALPQKPKPGDPKPPELRASEALTLVLGENHRVFYYFGVPDSVSKVPKISTTNFSDNGLRPILQKFNTTVLALQQQKGWRVVGPMVLIKPIDKAKYGDVVNALDEMKIAGIERYALVPVSAPEMLFVKNAVDSSGSPGNKKSVF